MKKQSSNVRIGVTALALVVCVLVLWKIDGARNDSAVPPEGYAVATTDGISFFYPDTDLVYADGDLWKRETYDAMQNDDGAPATDVTPAVLIKVVEGEGRTLDEVAIAEQKFGTARTLAEIDAFKTPSDAFSHEFYNVNERNVLVVHAAEKFDTTTYYVEDTDRVIVFTTLFSSDENLARIEAMIATIQSK